MKYTEILEQLINEINMSPSSLRQLAAGIDARAGMEFEMIVPNVASADDDYYESEPDYDSDESARSFRQIRDFFYDGDYNSRRDVDRLEQELLDNYMDSDFLSEKKQEAWGEAAHDAVTSLVDRDYDSEFREQAEEEVKAKTPEFGVNADELKQAIDDRYRELFDAKVDEILADMGPEYDEAYEEWEQNEWQDIWNDFDIQEEWLEHEGLETMSDVANNYDITWPHYTTPDNQGEVDIADIADEFKNVIGRPVNHSSNYHGARRAENTYVVEPDGSLDPDDVADSGLEFVSPPLPISELLSDLRTVKAWADEKGCYTNDSTGLHINVSVPGFSNEKLDFVKLAILLGDDYILNEFGRQGNTYCKSALGIVKSHIKQRPEDAAALLNKMKEHLNTAAAKVIHSGATSKYTSINTKTGYIEFRSPGGDWLNENFDKIENTLLRFVVALDAAVDETKYKEEYAKKLYKLLAPSNDSSDTLQYFAKFSAGQLPRSALTSFVKQAQLQRKLKKGPTGRESYWWNVQWDANRRMEVVAKTAEVAKQVAAEEWNVPIEQLAGAEVTPLRPYQEPGPVRATVGEPQAIGQRSDPYQSVPIPGVQDVELDIPLADRNRLSQTDIENRLGWGGQEADANYEVIDRSNNRSVFKFIANTPQEAARKYGQVLDVFGFPHDTENYGFREIARPGSTLDLQRQRVSAGDFTGQWKVMIDGEEVYRFGGAGNNQGDANRIAREWIRQQIARGTLNPSDDADITVVPVMQ